LKFPVLETERLLLSEILDTDAKAIFDIFSDESVVKYYDLDAFDDIAQAQDLIAFFSSRFESSSGIRWGIRDKQDGALMGTCGFNSWVIPMKNAVIGYELHPKHWRKGIAKEALAAMLQAAFDGQLSCGAIHRVQADTVPGNDASERLLLSLGFIHEGVRRGSGYWKNKFHDLNCFGLLTDEYK